jgi:1-acyl-sn-glycerol-3-phosphate acyltransferase
MTGNRKPSKIGRVPKFSGGGGAKSEPGPAAPPHEAHSAAHSGAHLDERLFRGVDPRLIDKLMPFFEALWKHYFRCEMEGWENIPDTKALYVGNHNGLLTFEVLMVFYAWRKRFGDARKALGLAHGIVLNNPAFNWLLPRLGAIPAHPDVADEAMRRNFSLLVYPGGEKESFRPYSERAKVDFYRRKGFLKLALRNKVPIVPIVSIGAHETYVILDRGEALAEALGLKKSLRLHGLPLTFRTVFFAWCVATGVFTFFPLLIAPAALAAALIPLPAKMKFRILEPINLLQHYDASLSEEENLEKLYHLVVDTMQTVLSEEYSKRSLPIIG